MRSRKKKAEMSATARTLGNGIGSSSQGVGLNIKINRIKRRCTTSDGQGMMSVPGGFAGCRLGGLHINWRNTATPGRIARGVSFCGFRTHGVITSVPHCGLMPCGKSHDLSLPVERSANPHGVSLPLGGWRGTLDNPTTGALAMMLKPAPDAHIASAEALPGAVSTLPSINEPARSEVIAEDFRAILAACSQATSTVSSNVSETVRMQVLGFLREVASADAWRCVMADRAEMTEGKIGTFYTSRESLSAIQDKSNAGYELSRRSPKTESEEER